MDMNLHIFWIMAVIWLIDIAWRRIHPWEPTSAPAWFASQTAVFTIIYGRFVISIAALLLGLLLFPFRFIWICFAVIFFTHLLWIRLVRLLAVAHTSHREEIDGKSVNEGAVEMQ
jgi:hypothetical protein